MDVHVWVNDFQDLKGGSEGPDGHLENKRKLKRARMAATHPLASFLVSCAVVLVFASCCANTT